MKQFETLLTPYALRIEGHTWARFADIEHAVIMMKELIQQGMEKIALVDEIDDKVLWHTAIMPSKNDLDLNITFFLSCENYILHGMILNKVFGE